MDYNIYVFVSLVILALAAHSYFVYRIANLHDIEARVGSDTPSQVFEKGGFWGLFLCRRGEGGGCR